MTYTIAKSLTVDEFIDQYGDDFRYELADGALIDREPTGPHEAVGGKLAAKISAAIETAGFPLVHPSNLPNSSLW